VVRARRQFREEEGTASPSDRRREDKAHGAVVHALRMEQTWWTVDSAGVRWRAMTEQMSRTREASDRASFKRSLTLTSGPGPNSYFPIFLNTRYLKLKLGTFLMFKLCQILQVDSRGQKEQLFFLDELQNPKG
jgi:hypothetical protein